MTTQDTGGIALPKRKPDESDGEFDITPMIDIVFLLLFFFVVTSKIDTPAPMSLPIAHHGEPVSEKEAVMFLVVDEGGGVDYKIYKGRNPNPDALIPNGDTDEQESEIGRYIDSELSADPTKEMILIKADADVRTRIVQLVKRGVDKAELAENKRIYVGIKEEEE